MGRLAITKKWKLTSPEIDMNETNISEPKESLVKRLRDEYLTGQSIPIIVRNEVAFKGATPVDVMFVFMEAFHLGLSDVACLDGWWPPDSPSEVTDANLDRFIRGAIRSHQSEWDIRHKE